MANAIFVSLDSDVNANGDSLAVAHRCTLTGVNIKNAKASALTVNLRNASTAAAGAAASNLYTWTLAAGDSYVQEFDANCPLFTNGIYVESDGDTTASHMTLLIV